MISKKNLLELGQRRKIYSYISKTPGVYLRELSRITKIPKTTLNHHLKYLLKQNLITTKVEDGYRRFFVTECLGQKEKDLLNLLRQETPRYMIMYLMWFHVFSLAELSRELGKKPPTILFHLKKFKKLDLIEELPQDFKFRDGGKWGIKIKRDRVSNEVLYTMKDPDVLLRIYNVLLINKDTLPDQDLINNLMNNLLLQFFDKKSKNEDGTYKSLPRLSYKIPNNPDYGIDVVINLFNEIFPSSFCA
jgi:DNA-binding transcriptional ArsR family regulator